MRAKLDARLLLARVHIPKWKESENDRNGIFRIMGPCKRLLTVIVSDGDGWDHASVSIYDARLTIPTWEEMCWVKDLVFRQDEEAFQYHPAIADYVNVHPGCLHIWRPQADVGIMPKPPKYMLA